MHTSPPKAAIGCDCPGSIRRAPRPAPRFEVRVPTSPGSLLAARGIYYGWWVVFACASVIFFTGGVFFYGFGLLVTPLTEEFGWSRAALSGAFSLRTEVGGVAAPVVGFVIDRLGVRRVVIAGVITVAVGLLLLSRIESLWAFYGAVIIIAIGNSGSGGAAGAVAVAHWFRRRRGRALGWLTMGGGASGATVILLAWLITSFGWRDALVILAVAQIVISLPLALSIRNRPGDMGLSVDGLEPVAEELPGSPAAVRVEAEEGLTTREALRSSQFWRIALAAALANFATTSVVVHLVPFLTESVEMSAGSAAVVLTLAIVLSLFGRLGFGFVADFLPKNLVLAGSYCLIALALALLATVHAPWQLGYVVPLYALGFGGSVPARTSIQAEYFGLKAFGAVQGMMLTVSTLGGVAGPVLAGWLYDISGSYRLAFLLLAAGAALAIPLIFTARRPQKAARLPAASAG